MTAWTEERRRKQAETIRRTKPWEKSTGPKTPEGKERCRLNGLKTGGSSRAHKALEEMLVHNRAIRLLYLEYFERDVYNLQVIKRLRKIEAETGLKEKAD